MANRVSRSSTEALVVIGSAVTLATIMSRVRLPDVRRAPDTHGLGQGLGFLDLLGDIIKGGLNLISSVLGLSAAKKQTEAAKKQAEAIKEAAKYQYQSAAKMAEAIQRAALLIMIGIILYALLKPKK